MGTNYYLHKDVCACCGRSSEALHIGKSSAGWCFSLHVIPEENLNDLPDWEAAWSQPKTEIRDEYDDKIEPALMLHIITNRSWERKGEWWKNPFSSYTSEADFYFRNHAQPGPNGLNRHQLGRHCIGHGKGTWDLITGEFS